MGKILIIGHPHGATSYTASLLQSFGLDIRHEDHRGKDGVVSWLYAVDDSYLNGRRGPRPERVALKQRGPLNQYDIVLHQVRDPLKSIRSIFTSSMWTRKYRKNHIPNLDGSDIVMGMISWVEWHKICDNVSQWTYRVESLSEKIIWNEFKARCQLPNNAEFPTDISTTWNSKRHKIPIVSNYPEEWTWRELSQIDRHWAKQAYHLAKSYGYEYDNYLL